MSQRNVERVIGRLVTDEGFRHRFAEDPSAALAEMSGCGMDLTELERRALLSVDTNQAERFADAIDPRIQKVAIAGGLPGGPAGADFGGESGGNSGGVLQ